MSGVATVGPTGWEGIDQRPGLETHLVAGPDMDPPRQPARYSSTGLPSSITCSVPSSPMPRRSSCR